MNIRPIVESKLSKFGLKREDLESAKKPVLESKTSITEIYVAQYKEFVLNTESLSEEAKEAHDRLYRSYLEKFNEVQTELDSINRSKASANHSEFRALKESEQRLLNAVYLHELYFANISDLKSVATDNLLCVMRLERDFGTFDKWQKDFMATCVSSRNGWGCLVYNTFLKRYVNIVIDDHDQSIPIGCIPIIVIDMWEHAYWRDFLDDKAGYVKQMMLELSWEVIENRVRNTEEYARRMGNISNTPVVEEYNNA